MTDHSCPTAAGFTYSYDRFGNRWYENVTSGTGVQPQYNFDANNHIDISGVTYDAAGNVTNDGAGLGNSYTYDDENRIIQVNGTAGNCSTATACYVYDAEGHRVRTTVNGQTRDFVYDLSGRNIDEFTPGGSGWLGTWLRGEAYADGLHIATYASGTTEFDNSDWLGTFRLRSGVTGTRIESCTNLPFGEDLTCAGTEVTPLHFTGKERDTESGLDEFGARYYASSLGRFMIPDWAAKPTSVPYAHFGNPQSLNLYSYVQNNPTTVGDPDGHGDAGTFCNTQCRYGTPVSDAEIQVHIGVLELGSAVATGGASLEAMEAGAALKAAIYGIGSAGLAVSGSSRIIGTAAGVPSEDLEKGSTAVTTVTNPAGMAVTLATGGNIKAGAVAADLSSVATAVAKPAEAVKDPAGTALTVNNVVQDVKAGYNAVKSFVSPAPPAPPPPPPPPPRCTGGDQCH